MDPNYPVLDSAATPRSEASDSDLDGGTPGRGQPGSVGGGTPGRAGSAGAGTPGRAGSVGRRPSSSGSAGGTSVPSRGVRSPSGDAGGGRSRKTGTGGASPTVLELEEGEGEVEDDGGDDAGATPSRPGTSLSGAMSPAPKSGKREQGLMGRLGVRGSFLSRRRSSTVLSGADEAAAEGDRALEGGQQEALTPQEVEDARFWVEQAQKLEAAAAPDGHVVKTLEKQKKALKRDQVRRRVKLSMR